MESRSSSKSISELREWIRGLPGAAPEELLKSLELDPRAGVRRMALTLRRKGQSIERETLRLRRLLRFEAELEDRGFRRIAGVDEAGMAPLAGPVAAAAVILPRGYTLPGLDDSKKIVDERKREALALRIKNDSVCWAVGWAEAAEIDRINIYRAGLLAMRRALGGLRPEPDFALVDARTIPECPCPQRGIVRGDSLSASIAAASILAKTSRDAHMKEMDLLYPGYGFASHKGYPTPEHLNALNRRGPLPIHRRSFGPVRAVLPGLPAQERLFE